MAVILALIVMVAAFNVVSTLTMVVRDKTREIGILRAMGLRMEAVRRIFLCRGRSSGGRDGVGALLGVGLGLLIDRFRLIALDPSVYFIEYLPVQLEVGGHLLILGGSLVVTLLATLHPASSAARLYPIEAIRSE